MTKRLQVYDSAGITVTFDPNSCTRSGKCVRGLPEVFDITRARWIRPVLAPPPQVAAQVARCPPGRCSTAGPTPDRRQPSQCRATTLPN